MIDSNHTVISNEILMVKGKDAPKEHIADVTRAVLARLRESSSIELQGIGPAAVNNMAKIFTRSATHFNVTPFVKLCAKFCFQKTMLPEPLNRSDDFNPLSNAIRAKFFGNYISEDSYDGLPEPRLLLASGDEWTKENVAKLSSSIVWSLSECNQALVQGIGAPAVNNIVKAYIRSRERVTPYTTDKDLMMMFEYVLVDSDGRSRTGELEPKQIKALRARILPQQTN